MKNTNKIVEGKVKVIVQFKKNGELHVESLWAHAWADVEDVYEDGYSDRPGSYHEEYSNVIVDIVDLVDKIRETFGSVNHTYQVDEESFEEN